MPINRCFSVPAISKSIRQLENYLGTVLFYSTNDGMHLTAVGEEFYSHIDGGFTEFDFGKKLLLEQR